MSRDREEILKHAPTNTTVAEYWCIWCQAEIGEVHSLACPNGERYWYFQKVGGLPVSEERTTNFDLDDL